MKYVFILAFLYALYKFIILKNVQNKILSVVLTVMTVIAGVINLIFEPSFADLLKRWI